MPGGNGQEELTRIGIISDTHNLVRPEALDALQGVAHIIHAGDICKQAVLDALAPFAPLTVVRGNNDIGDDVAQLPEQARIELEGATIHVVHDIADMPGNLDGVDVVITGHSHKPVIERRGGVLFVNPGSAGPRRFRLPISLALMDIEKGRVVNCTLNCPQKLDIDLTFWGVFHGEVQRAVPAASS
ncbi:putative phosphoesterase [Candidatus Burkholderia pumila]|uniref:Phosphoesterase n=1 Tax=Candidatus Burkholderia pumila TaxID=1090375 RepID=A0ABR5HL77_9BURK|nr:putative phosphoesterase [Candidatus Burkholderia pumila]